MTLTEFLLARIEDDEFDATFAQSSREPPVERWEVVTGRATSFDTVRQVGPHLNQPDVARGVVRGARHIVRWDPARVLAECAAKRRIVAWAELHPTPVNESPQHTFRYALLLLALPYADHPDFNPVWRL